MIKNKMHDLLLKKCDITNKVIYYIRGRIASIAVKLLWIKKTGVYVGMLCLFLL